MKTIYVKYYDPREIFDDSMIAELTDEDIMDACFRVFKCADEEHALIVYANTMCTWSTLLDDSTDVAAWVKSAYEHIKAHDYEWLECNFV